MWNMIKKIVSLILSANKMFSSEYSEILYRSSEDTYQPRKNPQDASSNSKDAILSKPPA
jgi:hypothetical protein